MTQILPPKKDVALALLERSNVDVYLDPRAEGVVVPPQYRKEPRLILKIGLNMPVPIPDLRLDDDSMSCTLSFNRVKFFCVVPWMSVFAIVGDDGRGMVWPDDVPQELAVRADERRALTPVREGVREGAEPAPAPSGRGKGKARLEVASARAPEAGEGRAQRPKRPRKKKEEAPRPALRAVPPPDKSAPRIDKLDDRRDAAGAERAPATPRISAPGARERPPASTRPKRELPPYLRVVK